MDKYLKEIVELLKASKTTNGKAVLNFEETVIYTGIGKNRLLELINSDNDFPYFRNGRKILVNKLLLDEWLKVKAINHETV